MRRTVERLSRLIEAHIRLEQAVRSFDEGLTASVHLGFTYLEFRALGTVMTVGPVTLKHLADAIGLPKTTLHYTLGKLESAGYIERVPSRKRRTPAFVATEPGREVWSQGVEALLQSPFGKRMEELEPGELDQVTATLRSLWTTETDDGDDPLVSESRLLGVAAVERLLRRKVPATTPGDST